MFDHSFLVYTVKKIPIIVWKYLSAWCLDKRLLFIITEKKNSFQKNSNNIFRKKIKLKSKQQLEEQDQTEYYEQVGYCSFEREKFI